MKDYGISCSKQKPCWWSLLLRYQWNLFWHVLTCCATPCRQSYVHWFRALGQHWSTSQSASTVRGSHTTSLARDAVRLNKGTSALQWWACLDYTAPFMTDRYVTAWDTKAQKLRSKVKNGKSSTRAKNNLKWLPSLHMVSNVDVI